MADNQMSMLDGLAAEEVMNNDAEINDVQQEVEVEAEQAEINKAAAGASSLVAGSALDAAGTAAGIDVEGAKSKVTAGFVTGGHTPELDFADTYALDATKFFTRLQEAANKQAQLPVASVLDPRSLQASYPANWASYLNFGAVGNNTGISSVPAAHADIEDLCAFRRYGAHGAPATPGGIYPDFNDMIKQQLSVLHAKLSPYSRWEERSNLMSKHENKQLRKMREFQKTKNVKTKALIQQDLDTLWNRRKAEHAAMEATFQKSHRLQVQCWYLPLIQSRQAVDFFVIYVWHYDDARLTEFYARVAEAWAKGVLQHQGLTLCTDTPIPRALEGLPIVHLCMDFRDADSAFQAGKVTRGHNVMIFDSVVPGVVCLKCLGTEGFRPQLRAAINSFVAGEPVYDSKMHTDQSACCGKPVECDWLDEPLETLPVAGFYGRTKSKWELTMTPTFSIKCKDNIRTVELEEVVKLVEGPRRDPTHSLERIKVKALKDGVEGWITSKRNGVGNQPDQISMVATNNGFYKCVKDKNKSQSDTGFLWWKGVAGGRWAQRKSALAQRNGEEWGLYTFVDDPAFLDHTDFTTRIDPQEASNAADSATSSSSSAPISSG